MIPGEAFHIIDLLDASSIIDFPGVSAEDIDLVFKPSFKFSGDKVFFIKKLILDQLILEDIVVRLTRFGDHRIVSRSGNTYIKTDVLAEKDKEPSYEHKAINKEWGLKYSKNYIVNINPDQGAVNLVTGGQESVAEIKKELLQEIDK
jgi:hypothetical protein